MKSVKFLPHIGMSQVKKKTSEQRCVYVSGGFREGGPEKKSLSQKVCIPLSPPQQENFSVTLSFIKGTDTDAF